jgi:adenylate cyclase
MFELVERMAEEDGEEGEGKGLPVLRAGIARGEVLSRGGDYYGAPVNLASRITDIARPGSLLVSEEVRAEVAALYDFSDAGHQHLKGISGTVPLFRCREPDDDDEGEEEAEAQPDSDDHGRPSARSRRQAKRRARRRR